MSGRRIVAAVVTLAALTVAQPAQALSRTDPVTVADGVYGSRAQGFRVYSGGEAVRRYGPQRVAVYGCRTSPDPAACRGGVRHTYRWLVWLRDDRLHQQGDDLM